jgi:hypothetical protein
LSQNAVFASARDELFSHIHRCGVLRATEEQRAEWMADTIEYLGERYPALTPEQLGELKVIGLRFCQPVIPHGRENTAATVNAAPEEGEALAGAA